MNEHDTKRMVARCVTSLERWQELHAAATTDAERQRIEAKAAGAEAVLHEVWSSHPWPIDTRAPYERTFAGVMSGFFKLASGRRP